MLNVFITVDTELWPYAADWRTAGLSRDFKRDIDGATADGEFGVPYQVRRLAEHGLKASFFVEALFAGAAGLEPLRRIVNVVQEGGQEVQLHLHPEWLRWLDPSPLPGRFGDNMKDFTTDEQALLIARGLENLRAAGARDVCAFRAGNYGAGLNTLPALARNGVRFDTSYNFCYLDAACGMRTPTPLLQPQPLHGVWEFPITFYADWPGHYRHAQLCACSGSELEHALWQAWERGWHSFVIVSHSFELIRNRAKTPQPDRIVLRRFDRLCRFLAAHRDKFRTLGFADVDVSTIPAETPTRPLSSKVRYTGGRLVEQLLRRIG